MAKATQSKTKTTKKTTTEISFTNPFTKKQTASLTCPYCGHKL